MIDDHRNVVEALTRATPSLTAFLDELVSQLRRGGRLIYIGAGTSGRLGVLDASECPPTFFSDPNQVVGIIAGGDAALRRSSEAQEDDPQGAQSALIDLTLNQSDTVVGIAAGGTTPYVLGALRIARDARCLTALFTCASCDAATISCDHLIHLDTGPELLTGSTRLKAGSATKLALNIMTTTAFVQLGKVYSNLMVDLRATNHKLLDRAIRILLDIFDDLTREEAALLLDRADNHLKTAIVMHAQNVSADEAKALLDLNEGCIRVVLNG